MLNHPVRAWNASEMTRLVESSIRSFEEMKRNLVAFSSVVALGLAMAACGYSEDEWQAQLAKYNAEVAKNKAANQRVADLEQQLEASKNRVAGLEMQLEAMGLDINKLNTALADRGQALADLNADMDKMRKALTEYQARAATLERIKERMLTLRKKLESLTRLGLNVNIRKNRMIISLPGDILFDSGKTELKEEGKNVLREVAKVVRNDQTLLARDFQVAGHTDNKPLKGGPYLDNWGLSLMRARTVLVFLVTPTDIEPSGYGANRIEPGGGLPTSRWSAAGYGETDPVAANDSPDNMQKNRRVELIVMPNVEEMLDLKSLTAVP
jgi:chemotaxis protein MotB